MIETKVQDFGTLTDYWLSFLQNALDNVFNLRVVYSYIQKSAGNPGRVAYYTGYAAYLLLDFEPMIPAPMVQPPLLRSTKD